MSVQCRCGGTIADTGMCPGCGTEGPRYRQALSAANATHGAVVRELHPAIVPSPGGRNVGDKPEIEAPTGPASIRALRSAIDAGTIPGTYVSNGSVVVVERVSGTPGAVTGDEDSPLPVTASEVRAPGLAALLAAHTYTFQVKMPGSGQTILTCGLGMLYGQRVLTWTHSDEELRKAITSVLADPVGTIIFDNLAEGTVIDSPVLARLITDRTWADRLLGKNSTAAFANDRVWTATGNNLRLGGDMRTRSVLVSLNPNMPRPEERTGFQIPNLDQWILTPANQRQVLWHLLVLVADWTRNGAPRREGLTMRQFTPWAEAVSGFLAHHGIGGFLANLETVRDIDEEGDLGGVFRPMAQAARRQVADEQRSAPVRGRAAERARSVGRLLRH